MIVLFAWVGCTNFIKQTRNCDFPILCNFYRLEPGKWSCEVCLGVRPAEDPGHILAQGCRYAHGEKEVARRMKKQLGQQVGAGLCRDRAIQAAGVVDGDQIIDDIGLDIDEVIGSAQETRRSAYSGATAQLSRRRRKEEIPTNIYLM